MEEMWGSDQQRRLPAVYSSFVGDRPKFVCLHVAKVCPQQISTSQETAVA